MDFKLSIFLLIVVNSFGQISACNGTVYSENFPAFPASTPFIFDPESLKHQFASLSPSEKHKLIELFSVEGGLVSLIRNYRPDTVDFERKNHKQEQKKARRRAKRYARKYVKRYARKYARSHMVKGYEDSRRTSYARLDGIYDRFQPDYVQHKPYSHHSPITTEPDHNTIDPLKSAGVAAEGGATIGKESEISGIKIDKLTILSEDESEASKSVLSNL